MIFFFSEREPARQAAARPVLLHLLLLDWSPEKRLEVRWYKSNSNVGIDLTTYYAEWHEYVLTPFCGISRLRQSVSSCDKARERRSGDMLSKSEGIQEPP